MRFVPLTTMMKEHEVQVKVARIANVDSARLAGRQAMSWSLLADVALATRLHRRLL